MPPSDMQRTMRSTELPIPSTIADGDKENQSPVRTSSDESRSSDLPASYLDIPLDEIQGEVPIYENASAIRRKLNKLLETKAKIPGTTKTFNKTTMSKELCAIADRHHAFETHQGMETTGPSVAALTRFLKQSGGMGGGDGKTYYLGNMLLEKLRIWN
ncbi:hypothetical protein FB567DRAFT_598256 [Paraphoma chrysanthemicola]|uniref:Uncharacterized protein n=1 Tax=Paraphoma chrysanthemicola TaxID=798071 RepID=A0A8K0QU36_9PLEO|nr:hypothetical protein FB567DRAFT_598256 [Paraphoma chrysanthemicola]